MSELTRRLSGRILIADTIAVAIGGCYIDQRSRRWRPFVRLNFVAPPDVSIVRSEVVGTAEDVPRTKSGGVRTAMSLWLDRRRTQSVVLRSPSWGAHFLELTVLEVAGDLIAQYNVPLVGYPPERRFGELRDPTVRLLFTVDPSIQVIPDDKLDRAGMSRLDSLCPVPFKPTAVAEPKGKEGDDPCITCAG